MNISDLKPNFALSIDGKMSYHKDLPIGKSVAFHRMGKQVHISCGLFRWIVTDFGLEFDPFFISSEEFYGNSSPAE